MTTVTDVLAYLDEAIPFAWAAPWDRVGLLAGDPSAAVHKVFVSLDPTHDALRRAHEAGADILLTHHPVYREPPAAIVPGTGGVGVVFEALRRGISLIACHTNLDRAPRGADALAHRLGLEIEGPLERGSQPMSVVTVFTPRDALNAVTAAMARAGAGRIGEYRHCSFAARGIGTFEAGVATHPAVGSSGDRSDADESRVEMVCPSGTAQDVAQAARSVHPYEEPVILVSEISLSLGAARMGRMVLAADGMTAGSLAALVGERLNVRPRVWGDAERAVTRIALAPGSGRSVVEDALSRGADAFVTGELRYHEALEASKAGLIVLEAGHDATEWPLTEALAALLADMPGLESGVVMDSIEYPWWIA